MKECTQHKWVGKQLISCLDCGKLFEYTDLVSIFDKAEKQIGSLKMSLDNKTQEFCHEVEQHGKTRQRFAELQQKFKTRS